MGLQGAGRVFERERDESEREQELMSVERYHESSVASGREMLTLRVQCCMLGMCHTLDVMRI